MSSRRSTEMACGSVLSSFLHITNSMAIKGVLSFAPNPPLLLRLPKAVTFLSFSASTKSPTKSFQGFKLFYFVLRFFLYFLFWVFVIPVICSVSSVHIGGIATCCCCCVTLNEPNPVMLFFFCVCVPFS